MHSSLPISQATVNLLFISLCFCRFLFGSNLKHTQQLVIFQLVVHACSGKSVLQFQKDRMCLKKCLCYLYIGCILYCKSVLQFQKVGCASKSAFSMVVLYVQRRSWRRGNACLGPDVHSDDRSAEQSRLAEAVGPCAEQQPTLLHVPAAVVPAVLQGSDHVR